MKILYFDVLSLLYSRHYLESNPEVKKTYDSNMRLTTSCIISQVKPDHKTASRLEQVAKQAEVLLYPLGSQCSSKLLFEAGVFPLNVLAPDMNLGRKTYPDDRSPVRRMLAHASALNAHWYACGDIDCEGLEHYFPERCLRADNVDELIALILDTPK